MPARSERSAGGGLVVNAPNPETTRLLPPLVMGSEQTRAGVHRWAAAFAVAAAERA